MKKIFLSVLLSLFAFFAVSQGFLKPPTQPPPLGEDEVTEPLSPPEERENARIFLVYKMKERLKLTEEQTIKVLEILKQSDEFRLKHREKIRELRRKCYQLLKDEKTPDVEFKKMIEEIEKERKDSEKKMEETEKKLLSLFTPRQQLEWLLFKRELQKDLHKGRRQEPLHKRSK